jgi:hypothetical protein
VSDELPPETPDDFDPLNDSKVREYVVILKKRFGNKLARDTAWRIDTGDYLEKLWLACGRSKNKYGEICSVNFPDHDPQKSGTLLNWKRLAVFKDKNVGKLTQEQLLPIAKAAKEDTEDKHNILGEGGVLEQLANRVDKLEKKNDDIGKAIAKAKGITYVPPPKVKPIGQQTIERSALHAVRAGLDELIEKPEYIREVDNDIARWFGLCWVLEGIDDRIDTNVCWLPATSTNNPNSKGLPKMADWEGFDEQDEEEHGGKENVNREDIARMTAKVEIILKKLQDKAVSL